VGVQEYRIGHLLELLFSEPICRKRGTELAIRLTPCGVDPNGSPAKIFHTPPDFHETVNIPECTDRARLLNRHHGRHDYDIIALGLRRRLTNRDAFERGT